MVRINDEVDDHIDGEFWCSHFRWGRTVVPRPARLRRGQPASDAASSSAWGDFIALALLIISSIWSQSETGQQRLKMSPPFEQFVVRLPVAAARHLDQISH